MGTWAYFLKVLLPPPHPAKKGHGLRNVAPCCGHIGVCIYIYTHIIMGNRMENIIQTTIPRGLYGAGIGITANQMEKNMEHDMETVI